MQILQEHLEELEFPKLLEEIAPNAYSPKVSEKVLLLLPMDRELAELSLKKTSELLEEFSRIDNKKIHLIIIGSIPSENTVIYNLIES